MLEFRQIWSHWSRGKSFTKYTIFRLKVMLDYFLIGRWKLAKMEIRRAQLTTNKRRNEVTCGPRHSHTLTFAHFNCKEDTFAFAYADTCNDTFKMINACLDSCFNTHICVSVYPLSMLTSRMFIIYIDVMRWGHQPILTYSNDAS